MLIIKVWFFVPPHFTFIWDRLDWLGVEVGSSYSSATAKLLRWWVAAKHFRGGLVRLGAVKEGSLVALRSKEWVSHSVFLHSRGTLGNRIPFVVLARVFPCKEVELVFIIFKLLLVKHLFILVFFFNLFGGGLALQSLLLGNWRLFLSLSEWLFRLESLHKRRLLKELWRWLPLFLDWLAVFRERHLLFTLSNRISRSWDRILKQFFFVGALVGLFLGDFRFIWLLLLFHLLLMLLSLCGFLLLHSGNLFGSRWSLLLNLLTVGSHEPLYERLDLSSEISILLLGNKQLVIYNSQDEELEIGCLRRRNLGCPRVLVLKEKLLIQVVLEWGLHIELSGQFNTSRHQTIIIIKYGYKKEFLRVGAWIPPLFLRTLFAAAKYRCW